MFLYKNIINKILVDVFITKNYQELKNICSKISKLDNVDDLLHSCIEQFIKNKKVAELSDDGKLYFFAKIVRNNYHSSTSSYYREYGKFKYNEFNDIDKPDNEYQEEPFDLQWVLQQLDDMEWYYKRLFQLYIEEGASVTKLSKRTTIPINSVSRDINKVRRELVKLRKIQKDIL